MAEREEPEEECEFEECRHPFHQEDEADDAVFDDFMELLMNEEAEPSRGMVTSPRLRPGGVARALLAGDDDSQRQRASFFAERCPRCGRPHHQKAAKS